jgi:hypothetical protein
MIIIGAGMAGLLAGGMIRDRKVKIYEAASDLPNNHSAVLRFRSSIVGDALDIQFKQVKMMKAVHEWRNPVADSLAYSLKCNGTATLRSIMSAGSEVHNRFIGPNDLIYQMSERVNGDITYDYRIDLNKIKKFDGPIISTIPMPILMRTLGYENRPDFRFINGFNVNCELEGVEAYVTVYVPDPIETFNRVSLTGNRMTVEVSLPNLTIEDVEQYMERLQHSASEHKAFIKDALFFLGIDGAKVLSEKWSVQRYSKILPIDEKERRNFIMWASANHNIYSLGRFATWRPGLLMDDVVNDVRVIRKIIQNGNYEHSKK